MKLLPILLAIAICSAVGLGVAWVHRRTNPPVRYYTDRWIVDHWESQGDDVMWGTIGLPPGQIPKVGDVVTDEFGTVVIVEVNLDEHGGRLGTLPAGVIREPCRWGAPYQAGTHKWRCPPSPVAYGGGQFPIELPIVERGPEHAGPIPLPLVLEPNEVTQ